MRTDTNFKVGDRIAIREWDDMAEEFTVDGYGDIDCGSYFFVSKMKSLCGNEYVIEEMFEDELLLAGFHAPYGVTCNMIRHVWDVESLDKFVGVDIEKLLSVMEVTS